MAERRSSAHVRPALLAVQVRVLKRFEVIVAGSTLKLPRGPQRLLGLLAVCGRHQRRETASGRLWPDKAQCDAAASLRNAIWRIRRCTAQVIGTDGYSVWLLDTVRVDLDRFELQARRLIAGQLPSSCRHGTSDVLRHDLLPDWDEEWVCARRERVRQLRLHALDALCIQLAHQRRYAEAVMAAHEALLGDPLRESTHEALIAAHLAAGNRGDAVHQYDQYARLMRDELQVRPAAHITRLVGTIRPPELGERPRG